MEPVNESQNQMKPTNESTPKNAPPEKPKAPEKPDTIVIRMWPKTPVLYPMAILALIFSLVGMFSGSTPHIRALNKTFHPVVQEQTVQGEETTQAAETTTLEVSVDNAQVAGEAQKLIDGLFLDRLFGSIFLLVFAFSLFTLSVDLEVRWALLTFASILVVFLLLVLLNQQYEFLPGVFSAIASLSPMANPQFYFAIFVIWAILMGISFGVVRFHYVRIESNEVIVVGGLLERQQRFPTMRMRYTRDIQDVFEYYMPFVRSGRLILSFSEQNEAVVIDNVLNIDKVTAQLDQISGVLHVNSK